MSLSHRYRQLAALIEALESHGITVQEAEPVGEADGDESPGGGFPVRLCVELPTDVTLDGLTDADRTGALEPSPTEPVGVHTLPPVKTQAGDDSPSLEQVDVAEETDATDGEDPADADGADAEHAESSDAASTPDTVESTADSAHTTHETVEEDTTPDEEFISCTHPDCDRTFETERGMKIHRTKAHPLSEQADRAADRTVHHDPELLASVYDEYETFAEMTAALDVDVGAQAVRKQMIRHGIHEPSASGTSHAGEDTRPTTDADTGSDGGGGRTDGDASGDADEPVSDGDASGDSHDTDDASVRTDSLSRTGAGPGNSSPATETDTDVEFEFIADRLPELGVPESLSTEDLQLAVEEATTLFDVQRALDLDQATTRDVLSEYDLLELVSGRAAALRDREELKDEIGQRIHRTAT